jgi:putative transposase
MLELQELLDEWLISCWLNRPHDGLRDPQHPGRAFTPNEKYAALVEAAGYVPVALGPEDYIELLPAQWRAVNAYGIKLIRRSYDSDKLNPLRLQPSGVREKKNLWEIRHDPYDVSRVFVRGRDGWITVFWKHLDRVPMPFGELPSSRNAPRSRSCCRTTRGGHWVRMTGSTTTRRGWRTTRSFWWWPLPPSSR